VSGWIGGNGVNILLGADDRRAEELGQTTCDWRMIAPVLPSAPYTFQNCWWPAPGRDIGDASGGGGILSGTGALFSVYPVAGANGRLALVGYTRDQYGSPLGGCTVKIFRTLDDSLQATIVSDADGLYSITTPYADGHYLIVYKAGPPDICGTTINTLAPG
jgi:hypothetical protein